MVFASLIIQSKATSVSILGPVRLCPGKASFAWKAAVDRATGIASTLETSQAPKKSPLFRHLDDDIDENLPLVATELFADYPAWLCRFPVTFGTIRAVPMHGGYEIRDRLFGTLLLAFGKARTHHFSIEKKREGGLSIQQSRSTVSIPITGGLLSRPVAASDSALVCTISTKRVQREKRTLQPELESCSIFTKLYGFRPFLTGDGPVHPLRAWFYLSTQSIVHAHVTWRLHRRCWKGSRNN